MLAILEHRGIQLPDSPGDAGAVKPDDIVDAAAAAWTSYRYAAGSAERLPKVDQSADQNAAIWY